jgi:uroporphyrinogen-III synthase
MRILLTRPIADSQRTVDKLEALGHHILVAPLFEIVALEHRLTSTVDALLATSANAIRACKAGAIAAYLNIPLFCVGDATAEAARQAGFTQVISAGADSKAVAQIVREKLTKGSALLYLAGRPRRDVLIQELQDEYALETVETYETIASSFLPDPIAAAFGRNEIEAVMHFSPRAAKVFMDLSDAAGLSDAATAIYHICISKAAVDARMTRAIIASHPTLMAMIEAIRGCETE